MTNIVISKNNNNIIKVVCSGHSGYAQNGKDIVCAAISSIVQTAILGLAKVVKIKIEFNRDDNAGYLKFELPLNISNEKMEQAQIILKTMLAGLEDLQGGYSKYIKLEVTKWVLLIFNFLLIRKV